MHVSIRPGSIDELGEAIAIDEDACALYEQAGLRFDIAPDHPFARAEYARWRDAAAQGRLFFATSDQQVPLGLLVLGFVDGAPHLDQLSVRRTAMRRGLGTELLSFAIEWAGNNTLWLETYAHIPWNRPFYERHGFAAVPAEDAPDGVRAYLREQQKWLPAPERRIAMCRRSAQRPPR